jgi:catechol 2,3-dioxygenase-like lactoylglutathione lyase family enzyme
MKNALGVHHVSVSVPDIETARRFYIDLLGAEEVCSTEWEPGETAIDQIVGLKDCSGKQFLARAGNTYIEVFEYLTPKAQPQDPRRPVSEYGYTHFGLQVDDIQAVYERMLAAGVTFHTPPRRFGLEETPGGEKTGFISTYGRDFFGNVFELIEINADSAIPGL